MDNNLPGNDSGIICPVCKKNCIKDAEDVISSLNSVFSKCSCCRANIADRQKPPSFGIAEPCPDCNKRFIDDVIAHCYLIMKEEGEIPAGLPLAKTGIPLVNPGFAMRAPPYLPPDSLVLLTSRANRRSAERMVNEVPEVSGIVKDKRIVPGVSFCSSKDIGGSCGIRSAKNELLAGCDVRCDVFYAGGAPFVVYKSQSEMHIEFPRGFDPKINSVQQNILKYLPDVFVDACCGSGTLGISAALFGADRVVFNDIWYPAAFWTSASLYANRGLLGIKRADLICSYRDLKESFPAEKPVMAAHFEGEFSSYDVFMGDCMDLDKDFPGENALAALDVFGKENKGACSTAVFKWKKKFGGDAFIP